MKMLVLIAILLFTLGAGSAFADQAEWVSQTEADMAAEIINDSGTEIMRYCAPCNDKEAVSVIIEKIEVKPVDSASESGKYWNVLVNGNAIDLAYVYVKQLGAWKNLGLTMELPVSDVPMDLP